MLIKDIYKLMFVIIKDVNKTIKLSTTFLLSHNTQNLHIQQTQFVGGRYGNP